MSTRRVTAIEHSKDHAHHTLAESDEVSHGLSEVAQAMQAAVDMSVQIAVATEQQSQATDEIRHSVEEINVAMSEISSASSEVDQMGESLGEIASDIVSMANNFK